MDSRHSPHHPLPQLNTLSLDDRRHEEEEEEDISPSDLSPPTSHHHFQPRSTVLVQPHYVETLQPPPRNRSPYSRAHLKSYTSAPSVTAPPMARTRSLPTVTATRSYSPSPSHSPVRQSSPNRSQATARITPRRSFDESHVPGSQVPSFMEIETIGEDSELDITPRPLTSDRDSYNTPTFPGNSQSTWHTFPRSNSLSRRRPASPLHQLYQPPPPVPTNIEIFPASTTPSTTPPQLHYSAAKYTESYPFSAVSSMPSTPTSLRSRSPSISSLDTIPDSPEAEEAAIEAFNIAKLKADADAADAADAAEREGSRRRGSGGLDVNGGGLRSSGWGAGGANRDKRKRWSVCGAERRGDFEMETIPEH